MVTVKHSVMYHCDRCGRTAWGVQQTAASLDVPVLNPTLPEGWVELRAGPVTRHACSTEHAREVLGAPGESAP
jgi:hypothetical protein